MSIEIRGLNSHRVTGEETIPMKQTMRLGTENNIVTDSKSLADVLPSFPTNHVLVTIVL